MSTKQTRRSTLSDVVTREYTIHLHKRVHNLSFKKKAPKAIKSIQQFAQKQMGTNEVRIDTALNKAVWSHGIKNVPFRIRVRISRRRNDDEDAKEKLYSYVTHVPVSSFKGKAYPTYSLLYTGCPCRKHRGHG
jgi:large subunit ribosomal protein L31e